MFPYLSKMWVSMLLVAGTYPAQQSLEAKFDPSRDAAQDVQAAIDQAQHAHKRIILDVGGEWCSWCHTLDRFFTNHPDLNALREKNYVWVKINYSPENKNEKLLSAYPKIPGYPHLFVLDQNGKLLHSQDTALLEEGKSYSHQNMVEFLNRWAPRAP